MGVIPQGSAKTSLGDNDRHYVLTTSRRGFLERGHQKSPDNYKWEVILGGSGVRLRNIQRRNAGTYRSLPT
jgi:hypothetical protein